MAEVEIIYGKVPDRLTVTALGPTVFRPVQPGEQQLTDQLGALRIARLTARNATLRKSLGEALTQIEHTSRYAYDPLGGLPQREFEAAWFQGDADSYTQWARLCAVAEAS